MSEHDEIFQHHQANLNILAGLRTRPAEEKLIKVHRCNGTTTKPATDYRCECDDYVSQTEANDLLRHGAAEWLTVDRGGKPYTRRDSIVIWSTREPLEKIAATREEKRRAATREKAVAKILKAFREKLSDSENEKWSNEEIVQAFETRDPAFMELPFMDGAGAKQKLLNASSKELADQSSFVQKMADSGRVYAAFYRAALAYWNKVKLMADHGLSDTKGQYMVDADKRKGLLVSGGYGDEKLAQVDAHREENADGQRRCGVANFRPGSGGLEMTVDGEKVEAEPTYKPGHDPIRYEEGDEEKARRLREKWLQVQFDKDEQS